MTLVAMRHTLSAIAALALVTAIAIPPTPAMAAMDLKGLSESMTQRAQQSATPVRKGKGYVAPATTGGTANANIYRRR
jgi:hypothetical protein